MKKSDSARTHPDNGTESEYGAQDGYIGDKGEMDSELFVNEMEIGFFIVSVFFECSCFYVWFVGEGRFKIVSRKSVGYRERKCGRFFHIFCFPILPAYLVVSWYFLH